VSVFDYVEPAEEQILESLDSCSPWMGHDTCDDELAFYFLGASARAGLHRPSEWNCGLWVPNVEVCHQGPILLSAVEEVMKVFISPQVLDPNNFAHQHLAALKRAGQQKDGRHAPK
jgi:hypothetical protein